MKDLNQLKAVPVIPILESLDSNIVKSMVSNAAVISINNNCKDLWLSSEWWRLSVSAIMEVSVLWCLRYALW